MGLLAEIEGVFKDVEKLNPITRIENTEKAVVKIAGEVEAWIAKQTASINKVASAVGVDISSVAANVQAAEGSAPAPAPAKPANAAD